MLQAVDTTKDVEIRLIEEMHLPKEESTWFICGRPDDDTMEVIENSMTKQDQRGMKSVTVVTTGTQKKDAYLRLIKGWRNLAPVIAPAKEEKDSSSKDTYFGASDLATKKKHLNQIRPEHKDQLYQRLTGNYKVLQGDIDQAIERGLTLEQVMAEI